MPGIRGVVATLFALLVAGSSAARRVGGEVEGSPPQAAGTRPAGNAAPRAVSRSTPHLKFIATISPVVVVPGSRLSIAVDVVPKKGMHVYAPGTQYRPVKITVQPDPLLRVHDGVYPKPAHYLFKPLNEEVLVYDTPFRLAVVVIAGDSETARAQLRGRTDFTIRATLDYQACDDRLCYLPASVPFQWTMRVAGE
jgi:DsbC/DsbD-like thiol-disulfide interchange protein